MAEKFLGLRPYAQKVEAVFDGLRELHVEDLDGLLREIRAVSSTNCGWSTYEAARIVRSEVEWSLRHRMNEAEAERKK